MVAIQIKRPEKYSDEIVLFTAKELFNDVSRFWKDYSEDKLLNDLVQVVRQSETDPDGFALAQILEKLGWGCSADTVNALERTDSILDKKYSESLHRFADQNHLEMKYEKGDKVDFNCDSIKYDGEIYSVDKKYFQYDIFSTALGHKKEGNSTETLTVNCEDVLEKILAD
jgi:hypothetical protein